MQTRVNAAFCAHINRGSHMLWNLHGLSFQNSQKKSKRVLFTPCKQTYLVESKKQMCYYLGENYTTGLKCTHKRKIFI